MYMTLIGLSLLIIASYLFTGFSRKLNIPSVIMLMSMGIALHYFTPSQNVVFKDIHSWVSILGVIGLILIVLEAALDIKLTKAMIPLIVKTLVSALILSLATLFSLGCVLHFFIGLNVIQSLIYAAPLSIMSSAIVIPSITHLTEKTRNFLMFEAAFSDVIGILLFYFLTQFALSSSLKAVALTSFMKLGVGVLVAVIMSALLIYLFHQVKLSGRLFLIISLLIGMYSIGELLHLSPLILILFFGIGLNNIDLLNRILPDSFTDLSDANELFDDFKLLIVEGSFLIRTVFFVFFGMTIKLENVFDFSTLVTTLSILVVLFVIRFLNLKYIMKSTDLYPEIFIAPRGLITILLYFSIPMQLQSQLFKPSILFLIIIATSVVMMVALIFKDNRGVYNKTMSYRPRGYNH